MNSVKNLVAFLLVFVLIIGAIPATAKTTREVWMPSPSVTTGVSEEEIMVNKAIHMGVARLYKLDSIGDKYYLCVLEEKFDTGGTNGNRDHSYLTYYSLLETDDSFIILGRDSLGEEYVQDSLEEVVDISDDIDIEYYEKQGYEAPIYIINPNGKYTCTSWEEYSEFTFIGSNGGMTGIGDCAEYSAARFPFIYENKFYTGKSRYISDDRGYFYYLDDGKTKATVKNLCGIKNGALVTISSSKVATTDITAANGYVIYPDEGCTGNVKVETKYLISKERNLFLTYQSYQNTATGLYDYKVKVEQIIDGNVTPVSEKTFCTDKTRDPVYTLKMISGLDKEKYTSQNMEVPIATIGKLFITEKGNIYEAAADTNILSRNMCIYNGMLSSITSYADGDYIYYRDEAGTYRYWQRINTLNFNKGKVTASEDIDLVVGAYDNLDGYYSSYKSFTACSNITEASVSSILEWWPHCLDNKFSDGRYMSGHWVANEAGSYEIWYDIYSADGTKLSTGASGYSLGASSQRYCPSIRAFVMNDTKAIICLNSLDYEWMEEYYRASVVTENDEGIVEVPMPIGKKTITTPSGADTVPTDNVVDFAADDLKLGFNIKNNVIGEEKLNPELKEFVNVVRLDSIVIVAKPGSISGVQNAGVDIGAFDENDYSFGNTPIRIYTNGQNFCWYCTEPDNLEIGTYNTCYPTDDKLVYVTIKVIAPPANDAYTTVVF